MANPIKKLIPKALKKKYQDIKSQQEIKQYEGNDVVCAICNHSYKKFAPFGVVERLNAQCLNCGSLERHRLLWKYIQEKELLNQDMSILHFAPEKVFYNIFSTYKNYTPCDLDPTLYQHEGGPKITQADITKIPFEDNSFDFVLCNHVLEHIPDDRLAMGELHRVMKKGGFGIFQVPIDYSLEETYEDFSITDPKEREKAFGQFDHVRWYGKDYKNRLAEVGFEVNEDPYVKGFSKEEQFKFGFSNNELIYLCKK